eukprot:gene12631-15862_t
MQASEICEASKEALKSGKFNMVRINFANPDMVGHTGDLKATIRACEVVDTCVKELVDMVNSLNGRDDMPPNAGLANITGTALSLLGFEPPSLYEAALI